MSKSKGGPSVIEYVCSAYVLLSYLIMGLLMRFKFRPFTDEKESLLVPFVVSPISLLLYVIFWAFAVPYQIITGRRA